jgi:septin family protein
MAPRPPKTSPQMSTRIKNKKQLKHFNLMVAGHSRTGKTDYIHTLFHTLLVHRLVPDSPDAFTAVLFPSDSNQVTPSSCRIECDDPYGEKVSLRLIDTPGMDIPNGIHRAPASAMEALESMAHAYADKVLDYIEKQFSLTLEQETRINRTKGADSQVHALLYFLNPDIVLGSKGINVMDRIVLGRLCERVNIFPCLAKSDLVTVRDLKQIQEFIKRDLGEFELNVYDFGDEDEVDEQFRAKIPFCIVNSEEAFNEEDGQRAMGITVKGEILLGREYVWGVIEVENPDHCDFVVLRDAILGDYVDDLRTKTSEVYYEYWRTENLLKEKKSLLVPEDLQEKLRELTVSEE